MVSWLPLYHDMGLIGCAFTPPWNGAPLHLLPPDLKNPRVWLEMVTRVGATFTVSPDFGYRNCVRNIGDTAGPRSLLAQAGALRRGAGPAQHHRGLRVEVRRAEPHHARATAWPRPPWRSPSGRARRRCGWTAPASSSRWGSPAGACAVRIMDGDDEVKAGVEAEICVASPGVMQGYYNNPEATAQVLSPDGWLRTGDLGFLDAEGYLYVTGRLKDVIILGGENVIPSDIEEIVDHVPGRALLGRGRRRERAHRHPAPARGGRGARAGRRRGDPVSRWCARSSSGVREGRGHRPARVLLVRPGTIPKTSSGKIQRSRLSEMIARDELAASLLHASGAPGG